MESMKNVILILIGLPIACSVYVDPYPQIYPAIKRPGEKASSRGSIWTGPTSKGRKGWVEIEDDARGQPQPHPPEHPPRNDSTVQVLISAFRDELCGETLFNLFDLAEFPDRLRADVVQQNAGGEGAAVDVDCLERYCALLAERRPLASCRRRQVRVYDVDAALAKGPTWARSLQSRMVRDDSEFCMQIDSHMNFAPAFDSHLLTFWADTRNEYGVLSTYVSYEMK